MVRSRERLLTLRREDDSTLFASSPSVKNLRAAVGGRPVSTDERTARIQELGRRGLPSFPGPSVVPEIVVGAPVLLREEMEAYDRVRMLAGAYRSAVLSKCDVRSNFMTSAAKLGAHKLYPLLVQAADMMLKMKIPPVAWAFFSQDVWIEVVSRRGKRSPAQVKWMYSKSRLANQHWFDEVRPDYCVRISHMSPKHADLARDWNQMWEALVRADVQTRTELWGVIDTYFPLDEYEKRVQAAKTEAVRMQRELNDRIALGEEGGIWRR